MMTLCVLSEIRSTKERETQKKYIGLVHGKNHGFLPPKVGYFTDSSFLIILCSSSNFASIKESPTTDIWILLL